MDDGTAYFAMAVSYVHKMFVKVPFASTLLKRQNRPTISISIIYLALGAAI
jgi:hypothetical protein